MTHSFSIELNHAPNTIFRPGDHVNGTVVLDTQTDETILSVIILFGGRSKAKIQKRKKNSNGGTSTSTHRHSDVYFAQEVNLYTSHYTIKAGRYVWPFEFVLPTTVTVTPFAPRKSLFSSKVEVVEPPRTSELPSSVRTTSHFTATTSATYGAIQYGIFGTVIRKGTLVKHTTTADTILEVRPFGVHSKSEFIDRGFISSAETSEISSVRLLPGMETYEIPLKEKLKDTFLATNKPTLNTTTYSNVSNTIIRDGTITCRMWLDWNIDKSTIKVPPPIYLDSIEISLVVHTQIRVSPWQTADSEEFKILYSAVHPANQPCQVLLGEEHAMDFTHLVTPAFHLLEARDTVPSFDVTSMMRYYAIKIKATFRCVKETWKSKTLQNVVILPAPAQMNFRHLEPSTVMPPMYTEKNRLGSR